MQYINSLLPLDFRPRIMPVVAKIEYLDSADFTPDGHVRHNYSITVNTTCNLKNAQNYDGNNSSG